MTARKSRNTNHPKKGSSIKVEPIRDRRAIKRIRKQLKDNPRDLCLFTLGINTAYRANELLSITVGQVQHLRCGDLLNLKQSKNSRYRATTLNRAVVRSIRKWLEVHPDPRADAPLFMSLRYLRPRVSLTVQQRAVSWSNIFLARIKNRRKVSSVSAENQLEQPLRPSKALTVSTLSRMVKTWCRQAGLYGNYGSHSLRKTWGYHQRVTFKQSAVLLTRAYGHASEAQTLEYLCIQPAEITELYAQEL